MVSYAYNNSSFDYNSMIICTIGEVEATKNIYNNLRRTLRLTLAIIPNRQMFQLFDESIMIKKKSKKDYEMVLLMIEYKLSCF